VGRSRAWIVGSPGFYGLSSRSPSCSECVIPWRCVCEEVSMSIVRVLKSVTGLCPKSAHRMDQRRPFEFCSSWSRSRNVRLWRLTLSLAVNLQPPGMCVFVSGDRHLVHMRDRLCFLLHQWMCTPHATSIESLLARKGVVEYACIVWSDSVVLASFRIWL
jgi:hypothetical protein